MNRLITTVICSLVGINSMLAVDPSRPKIVVGIMVDQLRTDYIESLQNLFGEKGFKKLMREGAFLKNVDFKVGGLIGPPERPWSTPGAIRARTG